MEFGKIKTDKILSVLLSAAYKHCQQYKQTSRGGLCSQTFLLKNNYKVLYYKVANVEPSESETEILSN